MNILKVIHDRGGEDLEHIFQYRRLPTTPIVPLWLPLYFWLMSYLLISVTIIVFGVILAAKQEISDPFSVFSDLFGDDARQAALALGLTCRDTGLRSHPQVADSCARNITHDVFSGVYLRLSGSVTSEISFWLQQNTLTLGDLVLLWGKPEIRLYCETVVAFWPGRAATGFTAHTRTGRISYYMPVLFVTFSRSGLSDWETLLINTAALQCGSVRVGSLGP
jgi:hypothetical protein